MDLPKLEIIHNKDFDAFYISSNEDACEDKTIAEALGMTTKEYQEELTSTFDDCYLEKEEGFGLQVFFENEEDAELALELIKKILSEKVVKED